MRAVTVGRKGRLGLVEERRERLRDGARAVAPIAVGSFLFSASFGVLAAAAGMGVWAAVVMSLTTFAGSAQFAAASILDNGGGALAAIVAAVLLNARYVPISISVASIFPGSAARRLAESQLIVDESWAISSSEGRFHYRRLVGAGLVLYASWNVGTVVGVVGGDSLGDPKAIGLDAAFPAVFLALLAPYLRDRRSIGAALASAAIAVALIPVAPAGLPIVAAAGVCLVGLRR